MLQAQLAGLRGLSAPLHQLRVRAVSLASEPGIRTDIQSSVGALSSRYDSALQQLASREQEINTGKQYSCIHHHHNEKEEEEVEDDDDVIRTIINAVPGQEITRS